MSRTPHHERTEGFILLQVLFFVGILNLAIFVLFIVALRTTQIQQNRDIHRHALWLARSEAAILVLEWNQGQAAVLPISRTVPGGTIQVTCATSGLLKQVSVVSHWGGGMDDLRFTYNTSTHQVTSWLDNYSSS